MHRRTALLLAGAAAAGVLALIAVVAFSGSGGSPAFALSTPGTPWTAPTATPTSNATKIPSTGNLSGVYNILVHDGTQTQQFFYCKARVDHDNATNDMKTNAVCYTDAPGTGDPSSKVPTQPGANDLAGPPPPPPYTTYAPSKAIGAYCPTGCTPNAIVGALAADSVWSMACFANLGGTLGPNVITVVRLAGVKVNPNTQNGTVSIYYSQSSVACAARTPVGAATLTLPITLTRIDTAPYDVDSDGDGCADGNELDKTHATKGCGDDPYNPMDSDLDFNATMDILVTIVPADICTGPNLPRPGPSPVGCTGAVGGELARGNYFSCITDLDHNKGDNTIAGRIYCYADNPIITVNIEDDSGQVTCPPSNSCGDGLPGAGPPGGIGTRTIGDVDNFHNTVTGNLDKVNNVLNLQGCYQAIENPALGPNAFFKAQLDAHTLHGTVNIWLRRPNCTDPGTAKPDYFNVGIDMAEQPADWDTDSDGCTDAEELQTGAGSNTKGGLRDPFNKRDRTDMNKDGFINLPDDILGVAAQFGPTADAPGITAQEAQADIGPSLVGSNTWNHRNSDGTINIPDDILGTSGMFGHTCDGNPNN